ncbi:MAG TPA: nuclear transport factor 2 family protein [Thermoleophilaceae bacterium]|nr:nuclear transport factor 2 family protein [Thermoleophilaceae bacterium]
MEREDLVRRAIDAVNARDVDGYLACCTDDVELITPVAAVGGSYDGPEGIRRFFADIEDAGPDFRLEVERLELVGERVLAFVLIRASGRSSGISMDQETANVYEFEGDRLRRVRIYTDRPTAAAAVRAAD